MFASAQPMAASGNAMQYYYYNNVSRILILLSKCTKAYAENSKSRLQHCM